MAGDLGSEKVKKIIISGEHFVMHASGALYWEEEDMLVISDVHLGKVSHFRKHGSAIPPEAIAGNFQKMDEVIDFFRPEKILFLGDLFHSSLNREWLLFEDWKKEITAEFILVEGNHDIISPLRYEKIGIRIFPALTIRDFFFTHEPEQRAGLFNFSGHIHPGVQISGRGRQTLRLACFFKSPYQMILPAFGKFTGKHVLQPKVGDEFFVVTEEEVIFLNG